MKVILKYYWPIPFVIVLSAILFMCSCSSVRKSQSRVDSTSVLVIDSVHVKKYDTSVATHEITEYQTKVIEVYDTVVYLRDSFITVLKTRTIWTNGKQVKDKIQMGSGYDSSSLKRDSETKVSTVQKTKEKQSIPWVPILLIALACLVARLGWWYISRK